MKAADVKTALVQLSGGGLCAAIGLCKKGAKKVGKLTPKGDTHVTIHGVSMPFLGETFTNTPTDARVRIESTFGSDITDTH